MLCGGQPACCVISTTFYFLARLRVQVEQDRQRKLGNQLRDLKEDYLSLQGKETDVSEKVINIFLFI